MAGEKWSLSFPQQIFSTQKLVKVSWNERLRENDANQGAGHVDYTLGNGAEFAQDPWWSSYQRIYIWTQHIISLISFLPRSTKAHRKKVVFPFIPSLPHPCLLSFPPSSYPSSNQIECNLEEPKIGYHNLVKHVGCTGGIEDYI